MVGLINVMVWNCRGAGKRNFGAFLKDLRRSYGFSLLVLLEPKLSGLRADRVVKRFGFKGMLELIMMVLLVVFGFFGMILFGRLMCFLQKNKLFI